MNITSVGKLVGGEGSNLSLIDLEQPKLTKLALKTSPNIFKIEASNSLKTLKNTKFKINSPAITRPCNF